MRPVLFRRGWIVVRAYPAMLYVGLTIGIPVGSYAAARNGLDQERSYAALLVLTIFALVGARLLHVISSWRIYRGERRRIWRFREGGAAMYGGLLLALPMSVPVLRSLDLSFAAFWDAATFTLLIGMVCTRVGCFLQGCCAGRESASRLAVVLPDHRGVRRRRLPSQLFEAIIGVLLLIACAVLWPERPFAGALFLTALSGYAGARLLLEQTRSGHSRLQQLLSAGLGGAAGILLLLGAV